MTLNTNSKNVFSLFPQDFHTQALTIKPRQTKSKRLEIKLSGRARQRRLPPQLGKKPTLQNQLFHRCFLLCYYVASERCRCTRTTGNNVTTSLYVYYCLCVERQPQSCGVWIYLSSSNLQGSLTLKLTQLFRPKFIYNVISVDNAQGNGIFRVEQFTALWNVWYTKSFWRFTE